MSTPDLPASIELHKSPEIHLDPATLAPDLRDDETRFEVARQLIEFAIGEPYIDGSAQKGWGFLFCAQVQLHEVLDPEQYEAVTDKDDPTMRERVEQELLAVQQGWHERRQAEAQKPQGPSIRYMTAKEAMQEAGEKWPWYYRVLDWLNSTPGA